MILVELRLVGYCYHHWALFFYLADLVRTLLLEVDAPHDTPYHSQILMCRRKGMTNVSGLFTHSALIVCAISGDSE